MTATPFRTRGFTLIELLLVIAVIGMLAGLLTPALQSSRERARQTACKNNLHQISIALIMYKDDMKDLPNWLSDLSPRYIGKGSEEVFICKSDRLHGTDEYACKPRELLDLSTSDANYKKVSDNDSNPLRGTSSIHACSYMYEFSAAQCDAWTWGGYVNNSTNLPANASWKEVKKCQLAYGDVAHDDAYSESLFPVVRCYHHSRARTVETVDPDDPNIPATDPNTHAVIGPQGLTLNVAYAGNIYEGPLTWEYTPWTGKPASK